MKTPRSPFSLRGKASFSLWRFVISVLALAPLAVLPRGYALPMGAQVVAGQVNVAQSGAAMTLTQGTKNAIVNWQSFNLGAGENLRLAQSGADAALLARVTGGDPTALLGALKADGKLFLINPKGIVVGPGAVIDTAAFTASTLDVADADFLRGGAMTFQGDSAAGIVNLGQISAREGSVRLFAHTVKNAGTIAAPQGAANLAAGTEIYVGSPDDSSVVIKLNLAKTTEKTGVENTGVITAAQAELKAAGGSIYDLAVNQSGLVRATGVETRNGRIVLTADGGTVNVGGDTVARNGDGSGGEIFVGGSGSDRSGGLPAPLPSAAQTTVGASATLDAGNGGRATVWSDEATTFLGRIVTGGDRAGFAEVSGRHLLDFRPLTSFDLGRGGNLLLDPDALFIGASDPGNANSFVNVNTLATQLASSDVTLATSTDGGDITLGSALAWNSGNTLRLNSGSNINLNASVTAASGGLSLYAGKASPGDPQHGVNPIFARIQQDAGTTIHVGTLTIGQNTAANVAGATPNNPVTSGSTFLDGTVTAGALQLDLSGNLGGVFAPTATNRIGALRTINSGGTLLGDLSVVNGSGALDVMLAAPASSAASVRVVTPGALTLENGTNLSFASPADVILASTGGAFTNNAGSSALGANGRFLIYSNSPGATTKGGLTGTDVFSHPYDSSDSFADTTSRFFFSATNGSTPTLTYRANDATRLYGDADPAFTFGVSGFQSGVTNDVTGAPALSATATQASGVGSYAINISQGSLLSNNYAFSFANGSLAITPAPLVITPNSVSRTYGDANPSFSASFSGLKNGDGASAVSGLTLSTSATSSSGVGNYAIAGSGASSANYSISYGSGVLTVDRAPLTVTVSSALTKSYGDDNPNLFAGVATSGLRNGDELGFAVPDLNFSTTATTTSPVGTYAVTGSGTSANYDVTFNPGVLTVAKALLTIVANDATRLYGDANPAFTASVTGFKNGDTASLLSDVTFTTSATPGSNVGNYAITPSGSATGTANYDVAYQAGVLAVTPAPLTIAVDNQSRLYGAANPAFTASVSGFRNGDTQAGALSGLTLGTAATTGSGVGTYAITASATASTNYALTFAPGTLTINPAPLTLTPNQLGTRTYGDATDPAFGFTAKGFVNGDSLLGFNAAGITYATGTTAASPAGSYALTMSGGSMPNYTIVRQPGTFTIAKAPLTVAISDATRTYGTANPAFTATYAGLRNGDTAAALAGGLIFSSLAATLTPVGSYSITGTGTAQNYELLFRPGALSITPATLTVTPNAVAPLTFGDAYPTFGYSVSGWAPGDTPTSLSGVTFSSLPTTGASIIPGNYSLAVVNAGTANANYVTVAGAPTPVSVARRAIQVTGPSLSVRSGSAVPESVPVDTPALVAGGPTFTAESAIPADVIQSAIFSTGHIEIPITIVPDNGTTREEIDKYYNVTTKPGLFSVIENVTFVDAGAIVPPGAITITTSGTKVDLSKETLDATPEVIKLKYGGRRIDPDSPMTAQDFADIITNNSDKFKGVVSDFVKSDDFKKLTADQKAVLNNFLSGSLSTDDLAQLLLKDSTAEAALLPVFGLYATSLLKSSAVMDMGEQHLLAQMSASVAQQRIAVAKEATQKYNDWLTLQKVKSSSTQSLTDTQIMPDVVTSSIQDVMIGAIEGGAAGGAAAGAVSGVGVAAAAGAEGIRGLVLLLAGQVQVDAEGTAALVFMGTSSSAAYETVAAAAGPAAAIIGIAVFVTITEVNAIKASDQNHAMYEKVLERAAAAQPLGGQPFELKAPQNMQDVTELSTSLLSVFSQAFK